MSFHCSSTPFAASNVKAASENTITTPSTTTSIRTALPPVTCSSSLAQFDLPISATSPLTTNDGTANTAAAAAAAIVACSTASSSSAAANDTAITAAAAAAASSAIRVGMKRDANCLSSDDTSDVNLDLHSWYSTKRANLSTEFSQENSTIPDSSDNGRNDSQNATTEEVKVDADATAIPSEATTALPGFAFSSPYCGAMSAQNMTQGIPSLINPVNLYGLAYSNQPGSMASPYFPAHALVYPQIYATQGTADATNPGSALGFNPWLSQSSGPAVSHQFIPAQIPFLQAANSPAMAALAGLQQSAQTASPDLSANVQSVAFQNQQAALLSFLLRAQQSQLVAAQMAAAMQASNAAGLLQSGSTMRPSGLSAFSNPCLMDPAYSFPGGLAGLCPSAFMPSSMSGLQNPITNVAYVNEKGHLLESLPICRDFKAGKCHRNGECRYVHLVDENVEVNQGRVIVCRDAAKGRCTRVPCKYYHVPLLAISANRSIALNSAIATATAPNNQGV